MIQTVGYNYWPPNEPVSRNKLVACTPFPAQNIEKKINRGIVMAEHKVSIQELVVVFAAESFGKDQKVYVRGDRVMQPWAKEVFTFEGKEFILVPEAEIVFAKWEYNGPTYFTGIGGTGDSKIVLTSVSDPTYSGTTPGCGGPPRRTE